jgi:hypothetical protein
LGAPRTKAASARNSRYIVLRVRTEAKIFSCNEPRGRLVTFCNQSGTAANASAALSYGWCNIHLSSIIETKILQNLSLSLVTSIDSETELAASKIGHRITARHPECRFLGKGIIIPCRLLPDLNNDMKIFHGFDEVWFFDSEPTVPKPNDVWLVSPLNLKENPLPLPVAHWMHNSDCRLGLGDGIGMNYVTPDGNLANQLEGICGSS